MKKVLLIVLVTLFVAACGSSAKHEEVKADSLAVDSVAVADSSVIVLDSSVSEIK